MRPTDWRRFRPKLPGPDVGFGQRRGVKGLHREDLSIPKPRVDPPLLAGTFLARWLPPLVFGMVLAGTRQGNSGRGEARRLGHRTSGFSV
jgi:hypothetical protein